jgi:hypothetical protein
MSSIEAGDIVNAFEEIVCEAQAGWRCAAAAGTAAAQRKR